MTNQIPKISIVIPSFNKVRYIGETLDSIFDQKYPNLEVIIQDGDSNDGTVRIIERFAKKFPKYIQWESKKDKGQLDAINIGMGKATGEILTFINADDYYLPGTFNEVARLYLENLGAYMITGRGKVVNDKDIEITKIATWYKNLFLLLNLHSALLILNYLMQPSVFVTRKAWEKYGPFTGNSNFVMEYDLWLKLASHKMPIITGKYLSAFRIEPTTITKTQTEKLLSEDDKIVRKYTGNFAILFLHKLHNYARKIIGGIV